MVKIVRNQKGAALLIILGALLVLVILANAAISIILSQSRLTHHQVSRIQAYYAAFGAINYAFDKLRTNSDPVNWPSPATSYSRTFCRSGCTVNDVDLPAPINQITVTVAALGQAGCLTTPNNVPVCLHATADYAPATPTGKKSFP